MNKVKIPDSTFHPGLELRLNDDIGKDEGPGRIQGADRQAPSLRVGRLRRQGRLGSFDVDRATDGRRRSADGRKFDTAAARSA